MKKVLFVIAFAALMLPASLRAQITAPWEPDLTSPTALADWTVTPDSAFVAKSLQGVGYLMGYYGGSATTPAITIPANANGMSLVYYVYGDAEYVGYGFVGMYAVVVHQGTNTDTVDEYYTYTGGQFEHMIFPLDSYAGQTINVEFLFQNDFVGASTAIFAGIKIAETNAPLYSISGPANVHTNMEYTYEAVKVEGSDTAVMTYIWSSLNGTVTPNGETATVTYTEEGSDIITLIAKNSYGSDTTAIRVTVVDCPTITSFPWTESFETETAYCWDFVANNGVNSDNFYVGHDEDYAHTGENFLAAPYDETSAPDVMAISNAIEMPADASGMSLTWYVTGGAYRNKVGRYEVLVSTNGTSLNDFTKVYEQTIDTSAEEYSAYVKHRISLSAYANQTIHIAFRNLSDIDADALLFDDIDIRNTTGIDGVNEANVAIFPNPVRDMLCIEGENVKSVEVIDMDGRVVLTNNRAGKLNMSELSDGVYMVRVMSENGVSTKKIVKK